MLTSGVLNSLRGIVGDRHVLDDPTDCRVYGYDASLMRSDPAAVVLPGNADEVEQVVRVLSAANVPFAPRGAGTGLTGGSLALGPGVVLALTRMNRILEVSLEDRLAVVEPGVINLDVSRRVEAEGLCFRPDPSSQRACTLGGNVANNAGGPHCLAYGVTGDHILELEVVLSDGSRATVGAPYEDPLGYDLVGLMVGSEGTLGVVTQITCRLQAAAEGARTMLASFKRMEDAASSVTEIIARGIIPAALEMMDRPVIDAVREFLHAGYPDDAEAVLLIEVEGHGAGLEPAANEITKVCNRHGVIRVDSAKDEKEREILWAGRKGAVAAAARMSPRYYLHDGVVPRTRLIEVLQKVSQIAVEHRLGVANVFHAGDGNLHPLLLFDPGEAGALERVHQAGLEVMQACLDAGGTLSGEHGIGLEKSELMGKLFSDADLEAMKEVKKAFDPKGLANPGKVLPTGKTCLEFMDRGRQE